MLFNGSNATGSHITHSFVYPGDAETCPLTGGYENLSQAGAYSVQVFAVSSQAYILEPLKSPWAAEPIFTNEHVHELCASLSAAAAKSDWKPPNLLLFGPVGAGKSSLARSLLSVLEGRIVAGVTVGTGEGTVTKSLKKYPLKLDDKTLAILWDTAGVEDKLYKNGEFLYLLQGNLANGTELTQQSISNRTPGFSPAPREEDAVDCVLACIAATDASDEEATRRMKDFNVVTRAREVPSMLVVTQLDVYDEKLLGGCTEKDDMRNVFRSGMVKKLFHTAAANTGYGMVDIVPLANFNEQDKNKLGLAKSVLALRLLNDAINAVCDFRKNQALHSTLGSAQPAALVNSSPSAVELESLAASFLADLASLGTAPSGDTSRLAPDGKIGPAPSVSPSLSSVSPSLFSFVSAARRSLQPSLAGSVTTSSGRMRLVEVLALICQEIGTIQAPPDISIQEALKEANESLCITGSGSTASQVKRLIEELGLEIEGWTSPLPTINVH